MSGFPRRVPKTSTGIHPKGSGVGFAKIPLTNQKTVGEQLRLARLAQRRSVEDIALRIRVSAKYLDSLERGRYRELPSLVYARHYARLYAKELKLPWKQVESLYEQEVSVYGIHPQNSPSERAKKSTRDQVGVYQQTPLVIPRLLKYGLVGMAVLLVVLYFVWEMVQFLSPPELVILAPDHDMIVSTHDILLTGKTSSGSLVEINGQVVSIEPDGHFEERVYLNEGLNTLRVSAHSKHSTEHVEIRHVLYKPQP